MLGDKKKAISIILSGINRKEKVKPEYYQSESEESEQSEDVDEGLEAAAEDLMSALESKDVSSFAKALKDFISMC